MTFAKASWASGPARPEFNDSSWRTVDLPHDWAIELPFVNVKDENVNNHGYKPLGRQFPETSIDSTGVHLQFKNLMKAKELL